MDRKCLKLGWYWLFMASFTALLSGCELPAEVKEDVTTIKAQARTTSSSENAVCNPFGNGSSAGAGHGLKAELFYLDSALPRFNRVADYVSQGTKVNADLFFDQVNVPTRPFDKGFVTTDGKVMTTPIGDTLYEWFAINFETIFRLAPQDTPNRMQFALIADDGAILQQKIGDNWVTIVDNDGTHGTKFKVATDPVTIDAQSRIPMRVQYYQGPRFHIAVMVMWRVWPENGNDWDDPLNGVVGNTFYFDSSTNPSTPKQPYNDLLARGWKPVPADNFYLPETVAENPCPPTPPVVVPPVVVPPVNPGVLTISAFDGTTTNTEANLIWQTTGFLSSGKIYWGTDANNLTNIVNEATIGNTSHFVQVSGLQGATLYYFQAESTDINGNTVRSAVITKTTK